MSEMNQNRDQGGLGFKLFVAGLALIGLVSRVAPIFDRGGRLLRQFPSEDGYLMLTIARNIALGRGMSTADGTILTNGTQPLVTFLWAGLFWMTGGDKHSALILIEGVSVVLATVAAWLLYRLGRRVLRDVAGGDRIAAVAAALWYASPLVVKYSMNCLETGPYALMVLVSVFAYLRWSEDLEARWPMGRCIAFGLLLGVLFWVRNDAVFFVFAACVAHVGLGWSRGWGVLRRRVLEAYAFGATSVVVAVPWLLYNLGVFGRLVPISGIKESMRAEFGANVRYLATNLGEYVLMVFPVPESLEDKTAVVAVSALVILAALGVMAVMWARGGAGARTAFLLVGVYGAALCGYYGLMFGMPSFVARYLMPLSPYLAVVTVTAVFAVAGWVQARAPAVGLVVARALPWVALVPVVALNGRTYYQGTKHQHFQVVEWVQRHVPEDVWVGAIQTGTLGFFHDRTLNLDGKVNPNALRAQLERRLPQYAVESDIQFIIDWARQSEWMGLAEIRENFDLIVEDKAANLAVLRRKGYAGPSPETSSSASR